MGQESRTDERILTEAARWYARLAADDCSDSDRVEFQRWWTRSRRHAKAYEATEALSAQLADWSKSDARLMAMADDAFAMGARDSLHDMPRDSEFKTVPRP